MGGHAADNLDAELLEVLLAIGCRVMLTLEPLGRKRVGQGVSNRYRLEGWR
jgi:hypothetical protein